MAGYGELLAVLEQRQMGVQNYVCSNGRTIELLAVAPIGQTTDGSCL